MPPKARITQDMIAQAAFQLVREEGLEALSVRAIAKRLGCSTQPVLYHFCSVAEIRQAAYRRADEYHTAFILPKQEDAATFDAPGALLAMGLAYVRFAREEPELFRLLFQANQFGGMSIDAVMTDPEAEPLLAILCQSMDCGRQEGSELFLTFFCVVHGMASLLANNAMDYDEEQTARMLTNVYDAMIAARAHPPQANGPRETKPTGGETSHGQAT